MRGPWINRWNRWLSASPVLPGVWRRKEGGYFIRARAKDPTGVLRAIARNSEAATAREALHELHALLNAIRQSRPCEVTSFGDFAVSLLEAKIAKGELRSAKTREQWGSILERHLLPAFSDADLRTLTRARIEAWVDTQAKRVAAREYAPATVNDWIKVLKVIVNAAVARLELSKNPVAGLGGLDVSTWRTYTHEEPNSLTRAEVPTFLEAARTLYPQHYAMILLLLTTGLRPSSVRPLRRVGPFADVLWDEGVLLVRRSHTRGDEVMDTTKTGEDFRIALPWRTVETLRAHVAALPEGLMRESLLLFPSDVGGYRSASCLDKPVRKIAAACGLTKRVTVRAFRRTFHDLSNEAGRAAIDVLDQLGAHAPGTALGRRYRTANDERVRAGLAEVFDLATYREGVPSGHGGGHAVEERKTAEGV